MTLHVGTTPEYGQVSYYNEAEKKGVDLEIGVYPFGIATVDLMYEKIKSKVNGELGCVCIGAYRNYSNENRKMFIESGLRIGFKSVEIINWVTAIYLNATVQIKYKLLNGNVIWIKWDKNIYVWEINKQKAKYIGKWDAYYLKQENLESIINESKLNKGPDIVLYTHNIDKKIFETQPDCQFVLYKAENSFISKGALLKAQITAGDPDLAHLQTVNHLSHKITLKIGDKEIKCFNEGEPLPLFYKETLIKTPYINFLDIVSHFRSETFILPYKNKLILFLKIDSDEIFSVDFSDDLNEEFGKNNEEQRKEKERIEIEGLKKGRTKKSKGEAAERGLQKRLNEQESNDKKITSAGITPASHVASFSTIFYVIPKNSVKNNDETVGIDLGTSRCCVAVNRKNGINTVPLDNNGERLLPSFVSYEEKNVKCGKVVVNRLRHFSKSTIFDAKRIIGRKFNDIEIDENWNFAVNFENEKVYLEINGFNGRVKITAEEVSADLLKYIKLKTEEFQGQKLFKAVITVPAAFTEAQKAATLEAANLAGWKEVQLLPEPIAAAFAYFVDRPIPNNSNILLFDLGGGTLDVCIFKVESDQIQILCNTGDSKLGGRNFDTVLINYFKNILNTKHGISALKDKKYKLLLECQRIKEDLSTGLDSSIDIDDFDTNKQGNISISREEFQRMTQSLLNKIQNTIKSALFETKMEPNQINKVLHVGGGSRMPMIKKLLQNIFSEAEHCIEEHPDEVVAVGAAYYACNCFSE